MNAPSSKAEQGLRLHFLSLPCEIRQLVYNELLLFDSDPHILLYHDRHGLRDRLPVHAQILRANKQINAEATFTLYKQNLFRISLSTPVFMRQGVRSWYADAYGSVQELLRDELDDSQGLIYPHCFRRLANIEITVSPSSVWAHTRAGDRFSLIGELLLELSRILASDQMDGTWRREERLRLIVRKDLLHHSQDDLFPLESNDERYSEDFGTFKSGKKPSLDELAPLLEAISRSRKLSIIEAKERLREGHYYTEEREFALEDIAKL